MRVVPLKVWRETIQPSPKEIAGIELARSAVGILCKVNLSFGISTVRNLRGIRTLHSSPVQIVLPGHSRQIACYEEAMQGAWTRLHPRRPVFHGRATPADGYRILEEGSR